MRCIIHRDEDALFNCYLCKSAICVDCESKLNGRSICPICLERLRERKVAEIEAETRDLNCPRACIVGLVAAGVTAFAWSQVALLTGSRLDPAAVVLGALVAYAVMKGAGGKRGYSLQQAASGLALGGILLGYFLVFVRTQPEAYARLSGAGSELLGALYAFPGYLGGLGFLGFLCLAAGVGLAYYLPHPRTPPPAGRPISPT
ncbi:MAG: B-box zinc finger protein [Armatimonadota bacterium]